MSTVETRPFGAISERVFIDGELVGYVFGRRAGRFGMGVGEGAQTFWFPSRDMAIAALVSYKRRGYWTGEIS